MRILLSLCLALPVLAGEYAVLHNGFRLHAERHETKDQTVVLHTKHGVIELSAASVASFELEEPLPQPRALEEAPVEPPSPPLSPKELVDRAAHRHGLPPEFLHSVAMVESGYRPDAVSPKGAVGIMQLMPATAAALGVDPRDPEQNVETGARHLRELLLKYDGGAYRALAAYNAGAGAVEKHKGIPPYRETQLYVERVRRQYEKLAGPREY